MCPVPYPMAAIALQSAINQRNAMLQQRAVGTRPLPDMRWDEFKAWWAANCGPIGDEEL